MNLSKRLFIVMVFLGILGVSWFAVSRAEPPAVRQMELISEANLYIENGIYVLARPLLEEAAGITADYTVLAQTILKDVHLSLGDHRNHTLVLEGMLASRNATPDLFLYAAEYFVERRQLQSAFGVIQDGFSRFDSNQLDALVKFHESIRYTFEIGRSFFDEVTATANGFVQVRRGNYWGIASYSGVLRIPCVHEGVSSVSQGRVITINNGVVQAVNLSNHRVALLQDNASGIGNFSFNRVPILRNSVWNLATYELLMSQREWQAVGMFSNNNAPAKQDGRWGVINVMQEPVIPFEHDGIVTDILGRAYAQNSVFIIENNAVTLFTNGQRTPHTFEDARPFTNSGYAAVRQNGLWGFIDNQGNMVIQPQFEDAQSFSQHLAAVFIDGYWGFLSLRGEVVIEPVFLDARGFYNGSAPVLTHQGWRFITLTEFRRAVAGL